jgi:hypothetical protein
MSENTFFSFSARSEEYVNILRDPIDCALSESCMTHSGLNGPQKTFFSVVKVFSNHP